MWYMFQSVPNTAGTMESRRENSKSKGPRASDIRCLLQAFGDGMGIVMDSASGERVSVDSDERGVRRAVGRLRD
jgi:hypothetical protein